MLKAGDLAPAFELSDQYGERVTLTSLLKRGPAIVFFYVADFTPG